MQIGNVEGLEVSLAAGKVVLSADLSILVFNSLEAKIQSGEIDPIKGTDLDKEILLKAIAALKAVSI